MRPGLKTGVNVDAVDIAAGIAQAKAIGYYSGEELMVVEYALRRHARGEEDGAVRTWVSYYPNNLAAWYMILAVAVCPKA